MDLPERPERFMPIKGCPYRFDNGNCYAGGCCAGGHDFDTCIWWLKRELEFYKDTTEKSVPMLAKAISLIPRGCNTCSNWRPRQNPACIVGGCEKLHTNHPENWEWNELSFEEIMKR